MSTFRCGTQLLVRAGRRAGAVVHHRRCGDARVWAGQVERLAARFSCVTYDRRGHTRSGRGAEPESVAAHAADAAALIEALGLARPVLVGSSGGARIAVELARTRPGLLAGAVFSEPPIFSLDPAAGQAFVTEVAAAVRPAAETGGPPAAVDEFFPLVCPGLWSRLDETAKDRYRANGPMMLAEFASPPYQLAVHDVTGITLPCLVIAALKATPRCAPSPRPWSAPCPTPASSNWRALGTSPTPSGPTSSPGPWTRLPPRSPAGSTAKPQASNLVITAPWAACGTSPTGRAGTSARLARQPPTAGRRLGPGTR